MGKDNTFKKHANRTKDNKIDYRNEIKYVCCERDLALIESRVSAICAPDSHADENGRYYIRSLYFDDYDNTCFYENEYGTDPREKFRIRIYNTDFSHITLECKRKEHGKNHKFSCPLSYNECVDIIMGNFSLPDTDRELLNKFYLQYSARFLRAKVIVSYIRTPYIYDTGNVRITFDRNISGSPKIEDFLSPMLNLRPVMPANSHVLEVKYDELFPDFLYNAMQINTLRATAFSKYYFCRKFCG